MKLTLVALLLSFCVISFADETIPLKLDRIYADLEIERPVVLRIPDDGSNRRFLVEQTGKIKILPAEGSSEEATVFLDGTDIVRVEKDFEEGLLGLAFHPKFKENGKFYISYSDQGPKRLVISEFTVAKDNPNAADMDSERRLIEIQQPEWNHNSGNILFNPEDGLLFICAGDGGLKNGVFMLPQKLTRWNGKVLRIDVDGRTGKLPYGIPEDNPFLDDPIACPEIYAYGLRNPWGAAIDPETGLFYLADVGQDLFEEIDIIQKGGNYGWEYREGMHDFAARAAYMQLIGKKPDIPNDVEFIDPIHEYSRIDGLSITGGFVYRGDALKDFAGHYFYGDWRLGNLWALNYDPAEGKVTRNVVVHKPEDPANPTVQPTGFYPDENGEVIVLGWKGELFRLVAE